MKEGREGRTGRTDFDNTHDYQLFQYDQVKKIDWLSNYRSKNNLTFLIEVDGGVNGETFKECKNADVLVAGSYVFKNNYSEAIAKLKEPV